MARSESFDPLLSMHYALLDVPVGGLIPLAFPLKTIESAIASGSFIGFSSIEMPQATIEMKDVKEGNWPYVHKVSTGFVDSGKVVLAFALMGYQTDMWLWFQQSVWGRIAPRRHLIVANLGADKRTIKRATWLEDCIPTSWTPMGSLAGNSTEVLVETLELDVHRIRPIPLPVPVGPNIPAP